MDSLLALELSGPALSISIKSGDKIRTISEERSRLDSFELKKIINDLAPSFRGDFIYGIGPGSFTGLRIGLSFLKGYALGTESSIYTFSSLHALVVTSEDPAITAIRSAGRGEYFIQSLEDTSVKLLSLAQLDRSKEYVTDDQDITGLEELKVRRGVRAPSEGLLKLYLSFNKLGNKVSEREDFAGLIKLSPDYVRKPLAKKISEREKRII